MPFLQRALSPDRPPLYSKPLPTDYGSKSLTNSLPETDSQLFIEEEMLMLSLCGFYRGLRKHTYIEINTFVAHTISYDVS